MCLIKYLLLLLTENGFIPRGSVLQCKTGQYNTVQYNTVHSLSRGVCYTLRVIFCIIPLKYFTTKTR